MPLVSQADVRNFLRNNGFVEVEPNVFQGFYQFAGVAFPVQITLREPFIGARLYLNFVTQCDRFRLYEHFNRVNSGKVLGKLAVAYRCDSNDHPLVLDAEIPAGPPDAYAAPESIVVLLATSIQTIRQEYANIGNLFRQGCDVARPSPPGIFDLLRLRQRDEDRGREGGEDAQR